MARRIVRMTALALVVTVWAVTTGAAPASAGQYVTSCGFILNPPIIPTTGEVTVVGSQFEPGAPVVFFIEGPQGRQALGEAIADDDPDGNVEASFPLPAAFATDGEYTVSATCPDGSEATNVLIVGSGITTTLATTPPGAGLPVTGSDNLGLARLGAGLLAAGALVLLVVRQRARAHH